MRHQLKRAWNRADIVLITGGLGPTHDDITRPVVAQFFDDELVTRRDLQERIETRFKARGYDAPYNYQLMAEFPTRANAILNEHGSAPGIHYEEEGKHLFAMPGVPTEMEEMLLYYALPRMDKHRLGAFRFHIFRTTGIWESHLDEIIGDPRVLEPVHLAYLPSIDHGVTLRLSMFGDDEDEVISTLKDRVDKVRSKIRDHVFTEDHRKLAEVLLEMMRERKMRLAVSESCTGGMICDRLIEIPGSSDVFERGFITYSNEAKVENLGVPQKILDEHGAVSEQTAKAMAEGAWKAAEADIGISVTGIAGPTGWTDEKPIGLVYVAVSDKDKTICEKHIFQRDRSTNRRRSVQAALTLLWKRLKEIPKA